MIKTALLSVFILTYQVIVFYLAKMAIQVVMYFPPYAFMEEGLVRVMIHIGFSFVGVLAALYSSPIQY